MHEKETEQYCVVDIEQFKAVDLLFGDTGVAIFIRLTTYKMLLGELPADPAKLVELVGPKAPFDFLILGFIFAKFFNGEV